MRLLLLLLTLNFASQAQTYSVRAIEFANGEQGPMKGIPGDLFMSTLTFSNSSASTIYVVMNRYKNDHPGYWAICYCYIQCHLPSEDSILIEIQPFSTTGVTVQFKTDSVNPGIAHNSFNIYQIGFESNVKKLDMTASTLKDDVGIKKEKYSAEIQIYPNPTANILNFPKDNIIQKIKIYDALGSLKFQSEVGQKIFSVDMSTFSNGIYLIEVYSGQSVYSSKVVKN